MLSAPLTQLRDAGMDGSARSGACAEGRAGEIELPLSTYLQGAIAGSLNYAASAPVCRFPKLPTCLRMSNDVQSAPGDYVDVASSREGGISMAAKFEVYEDMSGEFRWRLAG